MFFLSFWKLSDAAAIRRLQWTHVSCIDNIKETVYENSLVGSFSRLFPQPHNSIRNCYEVLNSAANAGSNSVFVADSVTQEEMRLTKTSLVFVEIEKNCFMPLFSAREIVPGEL